MAEVPAQTLPETEPFVPTSDETEVEKPTNQTPPEPAELPAKGEIDYKKKFSESKEEALKIREENKRLAEEKVELEAKLAEASESSFEKDLSGKTLDWDLMTDNEKNIVRNQEKLAKELADIKEEKAWENDFAKAKVKFPKLAEREEEFKEYCYKYPKGIDAETLAKSFLFEEAKLEPKQVRKGLEPSSAGPKNIQTSEMTLEDIKRLRENDPKLYVKMLRENRIKVPEK